jgi:AcrR family transcriptional regulator
LRTREAILDAARQIIGESGVEGLSIRAIAERIDYSPASLYEYFGSKEEILAAVCWQGHNRLTAQMTAVDATLSANDYLLAIGKAYIAFAVENPDYYLMMFTNPAFAGSAQEQQQAESSFTILLTAVQRGLDEGLFQRRAGYDLMEMAYTAWAMVHGISMLRLTYLTNQPVDFAVADDASLRTLISGLMGR